MAGYPISHISNLSKPPKYLQRLLNIGLLATLIGLVMPTDLQAATTDPAPAIDWQLWD